MSLFLYLRIRSKKIIEIKIYKIIFVYVYSLIMAVDDRKKILNRNRVKKHREKKKLLKEYENAVHLEMAKRICSQNGSTRENININMIDLEQRENFRENKFDLENELQNWAIKHRITHMAVKDLLSVLNAAGVSSGICKPLPKDSRTVLKTPKNVNIQTLSHGKMWYYGVQKCLETIFEKLNRDISITLNFNFDGVPLYNSSRICFWPILAAIKGNLFFLTIVFIFIYI